MLLPAGLRRGRLISSRKAGRVNPRLCPVRRRILLTLAPEVWFARLSDLPGIRLAPMPPTLLIASAFLPGSPPRDPADRIIAATARAHDLAIVTRDSELIPYAKAGHVMTIAC